MRYYTVEFDGIEKTAVSEDGEKLYILPQFSDMNELIEKGGVPEIPGDAVIAGKDVKILSPIPHPRQDVLCLGINYAAHAVEADRFSKEAFGGERPYPIFFSKRVNYSQGPDAAIPSHKGLVDSLDYECELGVVIGKDAWQVKKEEVQEYIFGYTIVNDVSARNLQTRHKQWYFGKSLDGFTPMGPCIVTADEFSFPPRTGISCLVNGEVRQDSNTGNLIAGIAEIVSMLSEGMTLRAGTIIATGTPSGVGMGMIPPTFLEEGDVVECRIEGIGSLRNTVTDLPSADRG
ncbi:MAG: fumarylacetoacetate hydrolase family protein [Eubacteriales bacterium]|nr:fumarylacetoacetate hydrolase family protein [Eubacteriales bacterium]